MKALVLFLSIIFVGMFTVQQIFRSFVRSHHVLESAIQSTFKSLGSESLRVDPADWKTQWFLEAESDLLNIRDEKNPDASITLNHLKIKFRPFPDILKGRMGIIVDGEALRPSFQIHWEAQLSLKALKEERLDIPRQKFSINKLPISMFVAKISQGEAWSHILPMLEGPLVSFVGELNEKNKGLEGTIALTLGTWRWNLPQWPSLEFPTQTAQINIKAGQWTLQPTLRFSDTSKASSWEILKEQASDTLKIRLIMPPVALTPIARLLACHTQGPSIEWNWTHKGLDCQL